MILWAMVICAVVGFVLGAQCRLLLLAVASALVAASLPVMLRATELELVPGSFTILGLLAVLQASFLIGAMVRVSGPVSHSTAASSVSASVSRGRGS